MRNAFLDTPEDIQWLKETHLKGAILPTKYSNFQSAVLQGNEDTPYAVNLYVNHEPSITDDYYRIRFINEPPIYCECEEYNGKTDKPYTGSQEAQ